MNEEKKKSSVKRNIAILGSTHNMPATAKRGTAIPSLGWEDRRFHYINKLLPMELSFNIYFILSICLCFNIDFYELVSIDNTIRFARTFYDILYCSIKKKKTQRKY